MKYLAGKGGGGFNS
jgi:hypothetical protein